jgi:hypothetical protein
MTKQQSTSSNDPRQLGIETPVHRFNGIEVPDNEDPWCAGYAAGLRASGSTSVPDDNVDPKVVVVRMLPDEYLDEAIAKSQLIELREKVLELDRRVSRLVSDYPPRPRLH